MKKNWKIPRFTCDWSFDSFEGGALIYTTIDDGIDTENNKLAKEIKCSQYKSTVAILSHSLPLPHSYFLKKIGSYLGTFCTHNQCWVGITFLIPIRPGFHKKNNYKTFRSSLFNFLKSLYTRSGYQYFYEQNLINSHDAGSYKFENSQLSLSGSHQLIIIISNEKIK